MACKLKLIKCMKDFKSPKKNVSLLNKQNIISTSEAVSGHPNSNLSAENFFAQSSVYNDRFVLSGGRPSPLLNALFGVSGVFSVEGTKTQRNFERQNKGNTVPKFEFL